ncbi:uncharacterized protein LOC141777803 [Sebastes fasciatus]|uniref:uncharacterized protein LOC141777803 n=1 Tax=Sebastes fasciatus TaxID=394691 RepID=UPI003D9EB9D9
MHSLANFLQGALIKLLQPAYLCCFLYKPLAHMRATRFSTYKLQLNLLLVKSISVHDEVPWLDDWAMESQQQQTEAEEAIGKESPVPICQSSRLICRHSSSAPSISEWPVSRLLEVLFENHIRAPVGSSLEELFEMFLESGHGETPPADLSKSCAPRKAAEKGDTQFPKLHCNSTAEPPSKRARAPAVRAPVVRAPVRAPAVRAPIRAPIRAPAVKAPAVQATAPAAGSVDQEDNPFMTALFSIQSSLGNMNSRIQGLESVSASPASRALPNTDGPSTSTAAASPTWSAFAPQIDDVIPSSFDDITVPRRSLGSAVQISTGIPFFPPAAAISHNLRSQTLAAVLHKGCFGAYTGLLLETVFLTTFFRFLRGGKFTTRTKSFDPLHDLTIADVTINTHYITVFLKHSRLIEIGRNICFNL